MPGTGLTADDIDECDWIVVGHSHFDHLYGAERIAANTGARIIGSYETVRVMEEAGVPVDQMICVAGGETVALSEAVKVTVYPSQHSCVWSHRQMSQAGDVCIGDLGVTWQEQRARFAELAQHFSTATVHGESFDHLVARTTGRPRRRRRARLPVRHAGGKPAVPGHLRSLDRDHARPPS